LTMVLFLVVIFRMFNVINPLATEKRKRHPHHDTGFGGTRSSVNPETNIPYVDKHLM
jgi:uncharacterized membrane protein YjgN (DUF898 family)